MERSEVKRDGPALECRQLSKIYGAVRALDQVDLTIRRGRIVGLLGPNGSGKTTLIKTAAGLLSPSAGELLVCGQRPSAATKGLVSYLPERTYLNDWMRVEDILSMFRDFYRDFDLQKAEEMLFRLDIHRLDRLRTMSKGTREKVQLILVMSRKAELYLLDEPIGGGGPGGQGVYPQHHHRQLQRGGHGSDFHPPHPGCGAGTGRRCLPGIRACGTGRPGGGAAGGKG